MATLATFGSSAQESVIDTFQIQKIVTAIERSLASQKMSCRYLVRKYMHNETTVHYEFSLDTASWTVYKCAYLVRTVHRAGDTTYEKTSFFMDRDRMVAAECETKTNGELVAHSLAYLKETSETISVAYPQVLTKLKACTQGALQIIARELRTGIKDLKEWLQKERK